MKITRMIQHEWNRPSSLFRPICISLVLLTMYAGWIVFCVSGG